MQRLSRITLLVQCTVPFSILLCLRFLEENMSDTMEVCDEEYGYNNSDYDDDSVQSYDSEDWGTSDPDEPSLITGGCKGM
jgi:hypothetical protein